MYILLALGLIANAKQRQRLVALLKSVDIKENHVVFKKLRFFHSVPMQRYVSTYAASDKPIFEVISSIHAMYSLDCHCQNY